MTGPREWRHAEGCASFCPVPPVICRDHWFHRCDCGLGVVSDAIAAGHRVVIGPDGVEGRLVEMGAYERRATFDEQAYRVEPS